MCMQIYSRARIEQLIAKGGFPQNTAVISFCSCGTAPHGRVDYSGVCSRIMYIKLDDLDIEDLKNYDAFFPKPRKPLNLSLMPAPTEWI